MLREDSKKLIGNERYEGFGIDLIQEIANMLGFNYTFLIQADGNYGSKSKTGEWNGMIKELLEEVSYILIYYMLA
jgi:ionotropic glutamate receptor